MTVLEAHDVALRYGLSEILTKVSLEVSEGELVAIVGPSGSGKSSLLNVLGLLATPTQGRLVLDGREVSQLNDSERSRARAATIGFVFQQFNLLNHRSVLENVALGGAYANAEGIASQARALIERVGLAKHMNVRPRTLSGGEKQRVAIARALMAAPQILLCDEPTGSLDSRNAGEVFGILTELAESGIAVVVVTHDHDVAGKCHRILNMKDGHLSAAEVAQPIASRARASESRSGRGGLNNRLFSFAAAMRFNAVEALSGLSQRTGRTLLTVAGSAIGVAALVATSGIGATASGQISSAFDPSRSTEVIVSSVSANGADGSSDETFPSDADARAKKLNGVIGAGVFWSPPQGQNLPVSSSLDARREPTSARVIAASPGYLEAISAAYDSGSAYTAYQNAQNANVAVIGSAVAKSLNINMGQNLPTLFVADRAFTVIGVLSSAQRDPAASATIYLPNRTARAYFGPPALDLPARMLVTTELGAASQVSGEIARALRPDTAAALSVQKPPESLSVESQVTTYLDLFLLGLGVVILLVSALSIANTATVAVLERASEFALRRALGARRWQVCLQVLTESGIVGILAGLVGTAVGLGVVVVVAFANSWTAILDPQVTILASLLSLAVALGASVGPAIRTMRVDPSTLLRSGT